MTSSAKTVDEYLAGLPEDRRQAISAVRDVILANLPQGYEEIMQYGMIGYVVPHSILPEGYHCDPKQPLNYISLGSQKGHMAIYMMCLYGSPDLMREFAEDYARAGKKLDMGKSCVRFKKLEQLPLDVIGRAVARVPVADYVAWYRGFLAEHRAKKKS